MKKIVFIVLIASVLTSCVFLAPNQPAFDPTKVVLEYQVTALSSQLTQAASAMPTQNPLPCENVNGAYRRTSVDSSFMTITQTGCVIVGKINTDLDFQGTWNSGGYFIVAIERHSGGCELKLFGQLFKQNKDICLLINGTDATCGFAYNFTEDTVWVSQYGPTPIPPTPMPGLYDPNTSVFDFEVFANKGWQDTGEVVYAGNTVVIEYVKGQWQTRSDGPQVGPEGDPNWAFIPPGYTMPDQHIMSMIARIGENPPFLVEGGREFIVTSTGTLWLSANDSIFDDNIGAITMRITIMP